MSLILNGTDGLSDVDGTATTPAIRGTDANTGIFFPAADTIAFSEGGTEAMRIDGSGNLGIGITNPTAKLNVSGIVHITGAGVFPSTGSGLELVSAAVGGVNSLQAYNRTGSTWQNLEINAAQTVFGTGGTERMRIANNNEIYIGATGVFGNGGKVQIDASTGGYNGNGLNIKTNSSTYPLVCWNNGGAGLVYFTNTGAGSVGTITTNGSSTTYGTSSDYRLKENIAPMTGALDTVAKLKPCTYTWKSTGEESQGFIAHELAEVVPDCVQGEKDEVNEDGSIKAQGIDTSFLVATLTAAIQELKAELDTVKAELATLKA